MVSTIIIITAIFIAIFITNTIIMIHYHSGSESVIDIILVDVILLISLISELPSTYLVSFAGIRRTGMMDEKVAPMVITDTGMIQGSFQ